MSAVVGIDFSSFAVDLVKLEENTDSARWTRADLVGQHAFDRLRSLRAEMPGGSFWQDVYLVGIELPFGRGQGRTQAVLQRVYGAVVASVPLQIPVWEIHSTEWRKGLGLKGNADKNECGQAVKELLGLTVDFRNETGPLFAANVWPQDALDAYAIAYTAREQNAKAITDELDVA